MATTYQRENIYGNRTPFFNSRAHTHLPSDRDFAAIEKYKRKYMKVAYVPEDWHTAVRKSRRVKPFQVTVIKQEDIYSFELLKKHNAKKTVTDNKEKLKLGKICCLKFSSDNPYNMQIKYILNGHYCNVKTR